MIPPIVWVDNVYGYTGYAHNVRSVIMAMHKLGVDVKAMCQKQDAYIPEYMTNNDLVATDAGNIPDKVLVGRVFNDIHNARQYKPKMIAGMLVLEGDKLQESHVAKANLCDQMWATSEFNRQQFINNGIVNDIIKVIPHGVDENIFNVGGSGQRITRREQFGGSEGSEREENYNFLFIGGYAIRGDRKGADVLVRAFEEEFKREERVTLTVKINTVYNPTFDAVGDLRSISAHPSIRFLTDALSELQLADLYRSADCYVVPTRGEGFGMTYAEAMACGLPTIYTNYGGHLDFCSPEYGLPVDVDGFTLAHYGAYDITAGTKWPVVSVAKLRENMRYAFDNQDEMRKKGQKASEFILNNFTWRQAAEKTIAAIEEFLDEKR